MEDDLRCKTTYGVRRPSVKDILHIIEGIRQMIGEKMKNDGLKYKDEHTACTHVPVLDDYFFFCHIQRLTSIFNCLCLSCWYMPCPKLLVVLLKFPQDLAVNPPYLCKSWKIFRFSFQSSTPVFVHSTQQTL